MIDLDDDDNSNSLQYAMTPMIDVIFVIIAFMMIMINAPLLTMEVNLPKTVEKSKASEFKKNIISIGMLADDKTWQLNDEKVDSIEKLKMLLEKQKAEHSSDLSIVIHSDKKVEMERVVQLFSILQALELNVSHLALQD